MKWNRPRLCWMSMLFLVVTCSYASAKEGIDDIAQLKQHWEKTAIKNFYIRLDMKIRARQNIEPSTTPAEDASATGGQFKEWSRDIKIWWIEGKGSRLEGYLSDDSASSWIAGESAQGFDRAKHEPSKFYFAGREKADNSPAYFTDIFFLAVLYYADPLKTPECSKIARWNNQELEKRNGRDGGIQFVFQPKVGKLLTVSSACDCRVSEIAWDVKGAPKARQSISYEKSGDDTCRMTGYTYSAFDTRTNELTRHEIVKVTELRIGDVTLDDLRITIPRPCLVTDTTGDKEIQYLLDAKGNRKDFTVDERKSAKSWTELLTPDKRYKSRSASSWFSVSNLSIAFGVCLIVLGGVFYYRTRM